jgi:hypothetical protein
MKVYGHEPEGQKPYSPAVCLGMERHTVSGLDRLLHDEQLLSGAERLANEERTGKLTGTRIRRVACCKGAALGLPGFIAFWTE